MSADPLPSSPPVTTPLDVRSGTVIHTDPYEILGFRVRVGATGRVAHRAVQAILGGFGPLDAEPTSTGPLYELVHTSGTWQVRIEGVVVHTDGDLERALGTLEWQVTTAALGRRDDFVQLHGASLCAPTEAAGVLLIGQSGQGKTTLALALALRGFVPFGDDIALLEPNRLELHPLQRAFHTDEKTWRLLEPLAGGAVGPRGADIAGYFSPPQWASRPVAVRWVLCLDLQPERSPRLVPLAPADAAARILAQTLNLPRVPRLALAACAQLTARAGCYRFVTGDLSASIALVQQLVTTAGSLHVRD